MGLGSLVVWRFVVTDLSGTCRFRVVELVLASFGGCYLGFAVGGMCLFSRGMWFDCLVTVLVFRLCIAYVGGLDWFVLDLSFMVVLLVMSLVFRDFDMRC